MPSLHSKTDHSHHYYHICIHSLQPQESPRLLLQRGAPFDRTPQLSHLLSSSHLVLKQGYFVHDQVRPDQSSQPGPADIRLTPYMGPRRSTTMPVRLQGPSWLHRGIWPLHTQAPRRLGSLSSFDLCNGAMSLFQNSRPTSSARYDVNTSLSRSISPHRRDWTPHIMSA